MVTLWLMGTPGLLLPSAKKLQLPSEFSCAPSWSVVACAAIVGHVAHCVELLKDN